MKKGGVYVSKNAEISPPSFVDKLKIRYRPIICPFDTLLSYAKGKKSVFDIGCGSGQFCALVAKTTAAERIMGIEINPRLVQNAGHLSREFKKNKTLIFKLFNGRILPEEIGAYEIVYMIDVFHHIPPAQQTAFMKQLEQKMKPGATLVFKDINAGSPLVLFNKIHDLVFSGECGNEITKFNAIKLLGNIGFDVHASLTKTRFFYPHYFIICSKPAV
jgi:2-polyprenyl-3-methyl-5-hydroxy-6-metoxy-1,4-benzoquinol methylase